MMKMKINTLMMNSTTKINSKPSRDCPKDKKNSKEIIMLMKHHTPNLNPKREDSIMGYKSKRKICLISISKFNP